MSELIQQLRSAVLLGKEAALTDGQLFESFASDHPEEALEVLVHGHAPMVWNVCRGVISDQDDAEYAFQATFLVFARKAASIYPRAKIGNWLYGVASRAPGYSSLEPPYLPGTALRNGPSCQRIFCNLL